MGWRKKTMGRAVHAAPHPSTAVLVPLSQETCKETPPALCWCCSQSKVLGSAHCSPCASSAQSS